MNRETKPETEPSVGGVSVYVERSGPPHPTQTVAVYQMRRGKRYTYPIVGWITRTRTSTGCGSSTSNQPKASTVQQCGLIWFNHQLRIAPDWHPKPGKVFFLGYALAGKVDEAFGDAKPDDIERAASAGDFGAPHHRGQP
jgi:hypothetical protein